MTDQAYNAPDPYAGSSDAPAYNPFLPSKLQVLGMMLGGLGSGISQAAQRNQPFYMGISPGVQNFTNSYYGTLAHGLNYDLARKKYELDASYRNAEMRRLGIQTNILQRQQDAFDAFMKGQGPPGIRVPQPPLLGPGSTPTPTDNNVGNVTVPGQPRFQQAPDFDSGVAMTVNNARSYPNVYNNGQPMSIAQIAQHWTPPDDGKDPMLKGNDPNAWAFNVSRGSGLDPNQPLDLNNPQVAAQFARGVHLAEKGQQAVRPPDAYLPGASAPPPAGLGPRMPQMPGPPPDVSGYAYYNLGGPIMGAIGNAQKEAALNQYKYLGDQYNRQMDVLKYRQSSANQPVQIGPNGRPVVNPAVPQAAGAKAAAEEKAKLGAKNDLYFPPNFDNMTQQQKLASLPANVRGVVQDLGTNKIAMSDLPSRMSSSGLDPSKVDIYSLTKRVYGDDFDMRTGENVKTFLTDIAEPKSNLGATRFSLNTAYQHINQYQDLMKALGNHDTQLVNHVLDAWNTQQGNPKFTNARALQHHLATEVARVVKGGNQLNEADIESGVDNLSTASSWEQAKGTLGVWMHAMDARWNTVTDAAHALNIPQKKIDSWLGPAAMRAKTAFEETQQQPNLGVGNGGMPGNQTAVQPPGGLKPGTVLGKLKDGREVYVGQDGKRYVR